jgi:amino acid transporter
MSSATSSGPTPDGRAPAALRRAVGIPTALATSAGLAFAAIDYLGVVSIAAFAAGDSAWLAVVVAAFLAFIVAGVFGELNGLFPTAAGIRLYLARAAGERLSMTVTFAYMFTVILVIAADAFLIAEALRHVIGGPAVLAYLWIALLVGVAAGSNLAGIKLAGSVQSAVTYLVLVSTTALSLVAIFHVGGAFRTPFSLFGRGGIHGIQAISFGVFLYAAFEWVTTTAEEARTPGVITSGLFLAPLVILATGGIFAFALGHAVPYAQAHGSPYPQLLLGQATLGTIGELWMLAVTLLTAINTFNGGFLVASRFIYAAARERTLPRPFARLNMRAVPWLAVVAVAAASLAVAAIVFATGEWLLLVAVGATIEAAVYVVACWCLIRLRSRETRPRPMRLAFGKPLAVVGMAVFGVLALASGFSDPRDPSKFSLLPAAVLAAVLALTAAYVHLAVPRLRSAAAQREQVARPRRRPERGGSGATGV